MKSNKSESEWSGKGRPPVGCRCEGLYRHGASEKWRVLDILMHSENHDECAVYVPEIKSLGWCSLFRPILTKEQKERRELAYIVKECIRLNLSEQGIANLVWANGWRKLKDD